MKVGKKFLKCAVSPPVRITLIPCISEILLTPTWLDIMHGVGGNISDKLNGSNFWRKRMTPTTFFFFFSGRELINIFAPNSYWQPVIVHLHNWSQTP